MALRKGCCKTSRTGGRCMIIKTPTWPTFSHNCHGNWKFWRTAIRMKSTDLLGPESGSTKKFGPDMKKGSYLRTSS
eukprot:4850330-Karenia_brevis.AAC.1